MFRLIRELRKGIRRSIRNWGYYFRWLYYQFLLKFTTFILDADATHTNANGVTLTSAGADESAVESVTR